MAARRRASSGSPDGGYRTPVAAQGRKPRGDEAYGPRHSTQPDDRDDSPYITPGQRTRGSATGSSQSQGRSSSQSLRETAETQAETLRQCILFYRQRIEQIKAQVRVLEQKGAVKPLSLEEMMHKNSFIDELMDMAEKQDDLTASLAQTEQMYSLTPKPLPEREGAKATPDVVEQLLGDARRLQEKGRDLARSTGVEQTQSTADTVEPTQGFNPWVASTPKTVDGAFRETQKQVPEHRQVRTEHPSVPPPRYENVRGGFMDPSDWEGLEEETRETTQPHGYLTASTARLQGCRPPMQLTRPEEEGSEERDRETAQSRGYTPPSGTMVLPYDRRPPPQFQARKRNVTWQDDQWGYRPRRPTPFKGEERESWNDWVLNFERVMRAYMGSEQEACAAFADSLEGLALSFFNRLPYRKQTSWVEIRKEFDQRFGLEHGSYRHRAALDALKWREPTPPLEHKQKFVEAWEKVYPRHFPDTGFPDDLLVDAFLRTITDTDLITFIGRQSPETVDQVCRLMQSWLNGKARSNTLSARLGAVTREELPTASPRKQETSAENKELEALRKQVAELQGTLKGLTMQRRNSPQRGGMRGQRGRGGYYQGSQPRERPHPVGIKAIRELYKLPRPIPSSPLGICFWCGGQTSASHNVHCCPERLRQEEAHPGSTYLSGQPPQAAAKVGRSDSHAQTEAGNL